jgi:hypothetical protein
LPNSTGVLRFRVLVVAAALLGSAAVGVAATSSVGASTTARISTRTLFAQLNLAPKHLAGYTAGRFGAPARSRRTSCDTAERVLVAEALVAPKVGAGCTLTGGQWKSAYDGTTVTDVSQLGVDHLVPLSEAWQSGAWRWSASTRAAFANDLGYAPSLVAVSQTSLLAKRARQPQSWLPPNTSFDCTYLAWWVAVKWRWHLAVDGAEQTFLAKALGSCGWPSVPAPARATVTSVLCQDWEHEDVTGSDRRNYQLLNIRYHARTRMCIQNSGNADNFTVTQEPGTDPAGKVAAFPEIFRGCLWNGCSTSSGMPMKVSAVHNPVSSWHARESASGNWNAAYELWFGKHSMTTGQADGAELMIWLNLHGSCCHLQRGAPKVRLDGRQFWVSHWRPCSRKWHVCFNYIQFRAVHHTARVDGLRLAPFITRSIKMKLIKRSWWLENVGAGFEIWKGGRGLATSRFTVRM